MPAFDISFAWASVTPNDVRAHGGEGVLVYSGNARPSPQWLVGMRDAGLDVVWIYETAVDRALDGYNAGVTDCRWHETRVPPGVLSYVVACDLNNGALAGRDVTAYLRGWSDTTREAMFGQYGSSDAIEQGMTVGGKLQRFWGVAPWLHNAKPDNHPENLRRWRDMGVHLIQLVGEDIPGTDTNETVHPAWSGEGDDDVDFTNMPLDQRLAFTAILKEAVEQVLADMPLDTALPLGKFIQDQVKVAIKDSRA